MRNASESYLIERAKTYDEEALSELYHRHVHAIYRYVFYRVRDQAAAEDLVGDVFVRALEGFPRTRTPALPLRRGCTGLLTRG